MIRKLLLLKFFLFVKTPYNVTKSFVRKTPLGMAYNLMKAGGALYQIRNGEVTTSWQDRFFDNYGGRGKVVRDIVDATTGLIALYFLWAAAEGDPDDDDKPILITGSREYEAEPTGAEDLATRRYGAPMTIYIKGWGTFDYGKLDPFGRALAMMVDGVRAVKNLQNGMDAEAVLNQSFKRAGSLVAGGTPLGGFEEMSEVLTRGPVKVAQETPEKIVAMLVPNLLRQISTRLDPVQRDTRGMDAAGKLAYTALPYVPGVGSKAPAKNDVYGQPVEKAGYGLTRIFWDNGKVEVDAKADRMIQRYNNTFPDDAFYPRPLTSKTFKELTGETAKLSNLQLNELNRRHGEAVNRISKALPEWIVNNPAKRDMDRLKGEIEAAKRRITAAFMRHGNPVSDEEIRAMRGE